MSRPAFLAVLSMLLAACGGSGNSPDPQPQPPAAPTAVDDAASAPTGRDTLIDVLANDSGDGLALVSVEGAGQAVLAIDGGRVRYRPRCCDVTSDSFRYTVRNAAGGTATATVRTTVDRRVVVEVTAPELGSRFAVQVYDGATPVDANARVAAPPVSVDVPFRTDTRLLRVEAFALGPADAPLARSRLVSILGDVPTLALAAGADGVVTAADFDAARVSSVSTALAGVLAELNDALLPTDSTTWDAWRAMPFSTETMLLRAQLVADAVANGDRPLLTADTFGLAASTAASRAYLAAMPVETELADRSPLLPETALAPFPALQLPPAADPPRTFWLWRATFDRDDVAMAMTLRPDGTGTARVAAGSVPVAWSQEGGRLALRQASTSTVVPLLPFGLRTLFGSICNVGHPFPRTADAALPSSVSFAPIEIAQGAGAPLRVAMGWDGVLETGRSPSGCNSFFSPQERRADRGLLFAEIPRGAPLRERASLTGAWLVPYCQDTCRGDGIDVRPMTHALASFPDATPGLGNVPGNVYSLSPQPDHYSVVVPTSLTLALYPVATRNGIDRVAVAVGHRNGPPAATEGFLAPVDTALSADALLRGVTLRECCRANTLDGLAFAADGAASLDGRAYPRSVDAGGAVVLALEQQGPLSPRSVSFTAIRRFDAERVLFLVRYDERTEGTAEIVRLARSP